MTLSQQSSIDNWFIARILFDALSRSYTSSTRAVIRCSQLWVLTNRWYVVTNKSWLYIWQFSFQIIHANWFDEIVILFDWNFHKQAKWDSLLMLIPAIVNVYTKRVISVLCIHNKLFSIASDASAARNNRKKTIRNSNRKYKNGTWQRRGKMINLMSERFE